MAKARTKRQRMITRLRKGWQFLKRHPSRLVIFAIIVAPTVLSILLILGYPFHVDGIGFDGGVTQITKRTAIPGGTQAQVYSPVKTVWDWLELLIVPAVLAAVGSGFTLLQHEREQKRVQDEQLATKFQAYIDFISKLLLDKNLLQSKPKDKDRFQKVVRAQTLAVLRGLDADRKGQLLTFLFGAELITRPRDADDKPGNCDSIIDLKEANLCEANLEDAVLPETVLDYADLSGARLSMAVLSGACLSGTKFRKADLSRAFLQGADLSEADFTEADLSGADLSPADPDKTLPRVVNLKEAHLCGANLAGANLSGVDLTKAILTKANLIEAILKDAILDGANLSGATYDDKQLAQAKSHTDLILHDGSKYSPPS